MIKANLKNTMNKGLTLLELLIVVGIMGILFAITLGIFNNFRNSESLDKVSGLVVEVLRQAKHSTIDSKDSNQYGVHFDSNGVILFVGPTYSAVSPTNQVYSFNQDVSVYSVSLNGGGNDVVFNKINGETNNNGIITLRSQIASTTKTITIYKTGLIEQ